MAALSRYWMLIAATDGKSIFQSCDSSSASEAWLLLDSCWFWTGSAWLTFRSEPGSVWCCCAAFQTRRPSSGATDTRGKFLFMGNRKNAFLLLKLSHEGSRAEVGQAEGQNVFLKKNFTFQHQRRQIRPCFAKVCKGNLENDVRTKRKHQEVI